ncbi:MAG: efflux RND transporter periplasmic adaptor subunit [Acidobacteriota bacterium]
MSAAPPRRLVAAKRLDEGIQALAARHGPPDDRPSLRKDLGIRRQVQMGTVSWIVKNPEAMKYFMFQDAEWQLIEMFDGSRSRAQIVAEYNRRAREESIDIQVVLDFEDSLRKMELIELSVAERNLNLLDKFSSMRRRTAEEKSEGFNIFFIRGHVLDPERILQRTVQYVRWIWTWPVAVVTLIASLWTIGVFVQNWDPIWAGTMHLYKFVGKPLVDVLQFFFILCIIGAIHEFGHAYAIKIYGGEVHDIGMALFYFTPVFYCDTSDAFMFPNKWHRLIVVVTGIYIEAMICSGATLVWVFSYPDSLLHDMAYKTMLLTGFATVFFNINPLIKVDGYYALSSVLELPDLREGAFRYLGSLLQKYVFRLPVTVPAMTRRKRFVYTVYGILSMAYTASIMLLIAGALSNFFYKYFPNAAIVLLLLSLYYIFRKRARVVTRTAKLLYLDKKELLMSPRSRIPLAATAILLVLLFVVPWSRRTIRAEATLRPASMVKLEATEEGIVAEVLAREGDRVEPGQALFRVVSPATEETRNRLISQRDRFLSKSSAGLDASNPSLVFQSDRRVSSVEAALVRAESRRKDLVVRSPIAGRILTPRTTDLTGRYVAEGALLAEVGDCRTMTAEIGVSERFLEYLRTGAPVSALVRTASWQTRNGSVASISTATERQPPTAGKSAPAPPTAMPEKFIVRAVFDNSDGALVPGAAARVKIHLARESYLSRVSSVSWRWLRTLFW